MSDLSTKILQDEPLLLKRFEIVKLLGEGSAGSVYLARDREKENREVALKILLNQQAFDEHTIQRFVQEIKVCQGLRHPNLVEAYDLIELGKTLAFTMEVVHGMDLGVICSRSKLSPSTVDTVFSNVLQALNELHKHGIVHRDIKLENILVRDDGVAKLSDLGLMKRVDRSQGLTRTGVLLGTAQYMPPEYVRDGKYDHRGDIYAVGVALYEVLSGKRRLADMTGMAALEYLLKTRFELAKAPLFGAPAKYIKVIYKATAIEPKKRYQSALEMIADLKGVDNEDDAIAGSRIRSELRIQDYPTFIDKRSWSSRVAIFLVVGALIGLIVALFF